MARLGVCEAVGVLCASRHFCHVLDRYHEANSEATEEGGARLLRGREGFSPSGGGQSQRPQSKRLFGFSDAGLEDCLRLCSSCHLLTRCKCVSRSKASWNASDTRWVMILYKSVRATGHVSEDCRRRQQQTKQKRRGRWDLLDQHSASREAEKHKSVRYGLTRRIDSLCLQPA